jgi:hypothetical protein
MKKKFTGNKISRQWPTSKILRIYCNFQNPGKFYAFLFQVDELALPFTRGKNKTYYGLWRPIFIILLYVIVIWRKFNCVKIPPNRGK